MLVIDEAASCPSSILQQLFCPRALLTPCSDFLPAGLLIENLLDLAHAPFTHTSTFARGWPVPDAVKFHATKLLSGNWDPYPINMAFMPPCITVSMIGLSQPGQIRRGVTAEQCDKHLHQLHVCMPSKKGHTRLLYRMSLDFIPWLRNVPFIDRVWKRVAAQVCKRHVNMYAAHPTLPCGLLVVPSIAILLHCQGLLAKCSLLMFMASFPC